MSSNTKSVINNTTHIPYLIKNYQYVSTKKIINAYKTNGFYSAIVEGKRGSGKSSYALKILHDVFLCLGYDDQEAWDKALDHMLFTVQEIVQFLKRSVHDKNEIVFCWDDAAVYGSSMTYFTNIRQTHLLQSMMDTIRGSVNGVLYTCPNQGQLLKFIRRYDSYIVQIVYDERGGWYRKAKGYMKYTLPSGTQRIYPKFHDKFSCYIPNQIYEKYMIKRESYNVKNIKNLEDMMSKPKEKRKWKKQ